MTDQAGVTPIYTAPKPFEVGDSVELKSGGPTMSIVDITTCIDCGSPSYVRPSRVSCVWFDPRTDADGAEAWFGPFYADFPPEVLEYPKELP